MSKKIKKDGEFIIEESLLNKLEAFGRIQKELINIEMKAEVEVSNQLNAISTSSKVLLKYKKDLEKKGVLLKGLTFSMSEMTVYGKNQISFTRIYNQEFKCDISKGDCIMISSNLSKV